MIKVNWGPFSKFLMKIVKSETLNDDSSRIVYFYVFWNFLAQFVLRNVKLNCIYQANTHIKNILRVLIVFQQNIAGWQLTLWLLVNLFCFCASCYFFSMLAVFSDLLETFCETLLVFLNSVGKTREMSLRYHSLTWLTYFTGKNINKLYQVFNLFEFQLTSPRG